MLKYKFFLTKADASTEQKPDAIKSVHFYRRSDPVPNMCVSENDIEMVDLQQDVEGQLKVRLPETRDVMDTRTGFAIAAGSITLMVLGILGLWALVVWVHK